MLGERVEKWLWDNRRRSPELLLACAMCNLTQPVESLAIAGRAAESGEWVAMLVLDDLGAGAHRRERAIAAGAPDPWCGIEEVQPMGTEDPRPRIWRAVDRCRNLGEGMRFVKKVSRRRCLAIEGWWSPYSRSLVMRKFGRERSAAAAQRAAVLLSTQADTVDSGSVDCCRRAETNAFLLMVARGWTGHFRLSPP
jgi:hypothetical protein